MRLTELLGTPVRAADGTLLGAVADVRFVLDGPPSAHGEEPPSEARLHGLIVGPRHSSSFAGYERTGVDRPWLVARFLAWRQRGAVLVLWADVVAVGEELALRPGAVLYSPALRASD